ncbi:uncharacterized protein (TIGR01777 family) [Paenibacillus shirakamiensis]|uniref:Uncharacterized protein (TIGR01777 family) n=1 Tax=Paenibacillus shirakamiensis TaxID=1265935 RepID=A0ABS4JFQ7_9BACL|nr:TIGR01777 family oxidoreductase [Paenibacillus shirakamiensis]MBP2000550.1 uncharacterized protein (TIGR01777 family) [Paenibacillus shirakamiensis]
MKMAIAGGTGFIGKALSSYWVSQGHHVQIITRKRPETSEQQSQPIPNSASHTPTNPKEGQRTYVTWDELEKDSSSLESMDAIVNLAGASLNQRWTSKAKKQILDSRLSSVHSLLKVVATLSHKPAVIIQGSAVGYYGTSLTETFDEHSASSGTDFLSNVTRQWEHASLPFKEEGIRLVYLRTSVVLGNTGGAYPLMRLPYKLGVGGRVGSGKQWVSWIHLHDMVRLIDWCIQQKALSGPVNAASPEPVMNAEFGRVVTRVHHRPYWFPLPAFLLKTILGDQSTLLLDGQRVLPRKALDHDFHFKFPSLQKAVKDLKE